MSAKLRPTRRDPISAIALAEASSPSKFLSNERTSLTSGKGNLRTLSKRRHMAGSKSSGWLVAAISRLPEGQSSISCRRTVTSRLNSPTSELSSLLFAIESTRREGECHWISWHISRTPRMFPPVFPNSYSSRMTDPRLEECRETFRNPTSGDVFPTPGGPTKSIDGVGSRPALLSKSP